MYKKKIFMAVMLVLIVLAVPPGCSAAETDNTDIEGSKYPLTITDSTNTDVTLQSEPKRIISLMPSLTETLYAIGAGEQVVGVTAYDNYPENAKEEAEYIFQDALNPSLEQIINLKPDLIVMGSFNDELTDKIRSLGIPVIKYDPQNVEQVYQMIEGLGKATNHDENAAQIVEEMQDKEQQIINKVNQLSDDEKVRVWVEISNDLWTTGKNTFMDELLTKAGGVNIVNDQGWLQYSEEKIIDQNPQVIITTYGDYDQNAINNIYKREGWEQVDAVKNKRVIDVNNDLVNRPGPRIIDGLEEIAKALYPDRF